MKKVYTKPTFIDRGAITSITAQQSNGAVVVSGIADQG